MKICNS